MREAGFPSQFVQPFVPTPPGGASPHSDEGTPLNPSQPTRRAPAALLGAGQASGCRAPGCSLSREHGAASAGNLENGSTAPRGDPPEKEPPPPPAPGATAGTARGGGKNHSAQCRSTAPFGGHCFPQRLRPPARKDAVGFSSPPGSQRERRVGINTPEATKML